MKLALQSADRVLAGFPALDQATRAALREAIAQALLKERAAANSEIQYRLGNLRLAIAADMDLIRKEIECVLQPHPLL